MDGRQTDDRYTTLSAMDAASVIKVSTVTHRACDFLYHGDVN